MKNGSVNIWMNLIGFDKNDEDRGVKRFLNQVGFKPDSIFALLCSPDFFNQHKGMDTEYILPPDNCAYWGIPRNAERERQEWTNYDVRALAKNLKAEGIKIYADIFGVTLGNAFHKEWIYEHKEIMRHGTASAERAYGYFPLKRFKDGTYYEDFFIDKVCETLVDYGMDGIHLADAFCPAGSNGLCDLEFSTDFFDQFISYLGKPMPSDVMATMGDDSATAEKFRSEYVKRNLREEWTLFVSWRWERFFKKLADRLHAIGKEVTVLGMYCTDPFETLYCLGINLKGIVNAGVDRVTANILPTSCFVAGRDDRPDFFHKYMALASTTAAHLPKGHLISMLGVQDATEEWSMIHHAPSRHERDIYSIMAYHVIDNEGVRRALDGYMICLGDGIPRNDWDWERERFVEALDADACQIISPVMLWSESANDKMLREYIKTRRWTPHKHFYEMSRLGTMCGATITPDGVKNHSGAILVPNIDMLQGDELEAVKSYTGGAILATASPDFDPSILGSATYTVSDPYSTYPLKMIVMGKEISPEAKSAVDELLSCDDGKPNLEGDYLLLEEPGYVLSENLVFNKVTEGFAKAMALLLKEICDIPFNVNKPFIALKKRSGAYRLYLYNPNDAKYTRAFVESKNEIISYKNATRFPILPPRWIENASNSLHHVFDGAEKKKFSFDIKIQPAGVTVVEIECAE